MNKKLIVTFLLLSIPQANAISVSDWWEICIQDRSLQSTCLLLVHSLESGIKAQAAFSSIQGTENLEKYDAAKKNGFCWESSIKENWSVKFQYFNAYVNDLYYQEEKRSSDIGLIYRSWLAEKYPISSCKGR